MCISLVWSKQINISMKRRRDFNSNFVKHIKPLYSRTIDVPCNFWHASKLYKNGLLPAESQRWNKKQAAIKTSDTLILLIQESWHSMSSHLEYKPPHSFYCTTVEQLNNEAVRTQEMWQWCMTICCRDLFMLCYAKHLSNSNRNLLCRALIGWFSLNRA